MQNKPQYLTLSLFSLLTEAEILKIKDMVEIRNCKIQNVTSRELELLKVILKADFTSDVITILINRSH